MGFEELNEVEDREDKAVNERDGSAPKEANEVLGVAFANAIVYEVAMARNQLELTDQTLPRNSHICHNEKIWVVAR